MPKVTEFRLPVLGASLETTASVFDRLVFEVEEACAANDLWELDTENLEGIRVRTGHGGFFMVRKSLHDPLISVQVEGDSEDEIRRIVTEPILRLLDSDEGLFNALDCNILRNF